YGLTELDEFKYKGKMYTARVRMAYAGANDPCADCAKKDYSVIREYVATLEELEESGSIPVPIETVPLWFIRKMGTEQLHLRPLCEKCFARDGDSL
ncbi:MAG: hypothetical protein Q8Q94_03240, partial [bacterium]|nr:hypothetical protein [bacterium]